MTNASSPPKPPSAKTPKDDKQAKLSAALRANLQRRKAAITARKDD